MRTVHVTRYVTPLREGGSLPAIVEADDDGMYVLKFRGAGQGPKVLIAELVAGEIGRALGLHIPEIVFAELDPELARTEPDPEIQELIRASAGLNIGLDYLPGSVSYDPLADEIDTRLASAIVWFDAFMSNVDRTPRNTNMLIRHENLWLIDHGSALYFHHGEDRFADRSNDPFALIRDHVLLDRADALGEIDAQLAERVTSELIASVVAYIPATWLARTGDEESDVSAQEHRDEYATYLNERITSPRRFLEEAARASAAL